MCLRISLHSPGVIFEFEMLLLVCSLLIKLLIERFWVSCVWVDLSMH